MRTRILRQLIFVGIVVAAFLAVGYYINLDSVSRRQEQIDRQVTIAVETAIYGALYDATRTAEADIPHYRLVTLDVGAPLLDVALQWDTTVDVIRLANGLLDDVEYGSGEIIIVPEGVRELLPLRRFSWVTANNGDTLISLALNYEIPLDLLERDNPILARRGVIAGDIVFIPELLR